MSWKIGVLTSTRAEYGLLKPVISALKQESDFEVFVLVTGTHLSAEFGNTYREIEDDEMPIAAKISILSDLDTRRGVSECMACALSEFAAFFESADIDALMVLGDRYETLAVCCAAMNARIPIIHLHGGETTEGAIDEAIRHSITKMSYLHFTSNEVHRKRVIQLGESPDRVFNVGATGVENALRLELLSKCELEDAIEFKLDKPYALVTFHPATLDDSDVCQQMKELETALDTFGDMKFIFTKANADAGGKAINSMIDAYTLRHENVIAFTSMGVLRYLSAMKYCSAVVGNSSSGIIEAPSFKVPTVNIGDRQKGRMQAASVINCECDSKAIVSAICRARSPRFLHDLETVDNPYGDGQTSQRIAEIMREVFSQGRISLIKKFYDIDFAY